TPRFAIQETFASLLQRSLDQLLRQSVIRVRTRFSVMTGMAQGTGPGGQDERRLSRQQPLPTTWPKQHLIAILQQYGLNNVRSL
ncbi:MAG: hypothetical protein WB762_24195, partial [Candidatus Sulfotelmatobacter sp.]